MSIIASGSDVVDAWKKASQVVIDSPDRRVRNMIVSVEHPTKFDRSWLTTYDPKSVGVDDRLSVVAKVLFPYSGKRAGESRANFYERWNKSLKKNRKAKRLRAPWGTYFERLTQFAGHVNQLENIIHALSNWGVRPEAALVAHLSSPEYDTIKPIGSPCLQYVELLWSREDVIDLVAVYRNHDFLKKALGNYIGLGQLLAFISTESGKTAGRLICHSVRAYSDEPTRLRALIKK